MKKRYEVKGMMEWYAQFVAGLARICIAFTGGHLGDGCCSPAVFETANRVIQKIIESSCAFRSGKIRLSATQPEDTEQSKPGIYPTATAEPYGTEAASEGAAEAATPKTSAGKVFNMVFDSIGKLADFLQYEKGVSAGKLVSKESILKEAKRLLISPKFKNEK